MTTIVFINYFNNDLLADGIIVKVYPLGMPANDSNLVAQGIIGAYPSIANAGQLTVSGLFANEIYYVNFIGQNAPTGSHFLATNDSPIVTSPIYYQTNLPSTFSNTTSDFVLTDVESLITIQVADASVFAINEYVLVTGNNDVFVGLITHVDTINSTISIFITRILAGNVNDTIYAGAFVSAFEPDDFRGIAGDSGQNGYGSTITTTVIDNPSVGNILNVGVANGQAFPNGIPLFISNSVSGFLTANVSANGSSNLLSLNITSISASGIHFPIGSTVSFTGLQGIQGNQGLQGLVGFAGPTGNVGPAGPGSTSLMLPCTTAAISASQQLSVINNTAFPVNSYALLTDGISAIMSGYITNKSGLNILSMFVQQSNYPGSIIPTGSTLTFSGPASYIPGPQGIQGNQGIQGQGIPGNGSTTALNNIILKPIGTLIQVPCVNSQAFPVFSYVLLSDGITAFTGKIIANNTTTNVMGVQIVNIINGFPNITTLDTPVVSFSGPPGQISNVALGKQGTSLFEDSTFSTPIVFYSGAGITASSVINTMSILLPSIIPVNYRVIVEFDGNVATNQVLTNNQVYLGLSSSQKNFATLPGGTFARYDANLKPIPTINYPNMLADGLFLAGSGSQANQNMHLKYIGTFSFGSNLDFTLVAGAVQLATSFYVQGIMTITCYPVYQS